MPRNTEVTTFHLGDLLSVTTGRLVSPRHMDGVYDILNYMTGTSLFTHQLPAAAYECRPAILTQHPELNSVVVPETFGAQDVDEWLRLQVEKYGEMFPLTPLSATADYSDPIGDAVRMKGGDASKVIVFNVGDPNGSADR